MEKKQSSVEFYRTELNALLSMKKSKFQTEIEIFEQAKQMEKEQNEYFFNCGRQYQLTGEGTFKQVHNETYGGQDEN
jgi:hypothetical protein